MATGRRAALTNDSNIPSQNDPGRELFEACRNGDLNKVKKLVSSSNVNAKDTAGRKSTPLHFAAGLFGFRSLDSETGDFSPLKILCFMKFVKTMQFSCL